MTEMTRRDRDELAKLTRQREKLAKARAKQRSLDLLAEFEAQVATDYHLNDEQAWEEAHAEARQAIETANARVLARCRELGIPARFAPSISGGFWIERGEHAAKARVVELRKVAQTRIAALEKAASTEIESKSLEVQTELLAGGLDSGEARAFLEAMPSAESLMPSLSVREIEALAPARASAY